MAEEHPVLTKIADLKSTLADDKHNALAALLDSEHRDVYKSHIKGLIDDLEWIFERMGADAPETKAT